MTFVVRLFSPKSVLNGMPVLRGIPVCCMPVRGVAILELPQLVLPRYKFCESTIQTDEQRRKCPHCRLGQIFNTGEVDVDFGWKCSLIQ